MNVPDIFVIAGAALSGLACLAGVEWLRRTAK